MRNRFLAPLMIVLMFGAGLLALPWLPERVPFHWNANGEVDGYSSPLFAILFTPLIGLVLWVVLLLVPRIDPRREAYAQFRETYQLIVNAVISFMALLHLVILGAGLGWPIDAARLIVAAVGVLFAVLGSVMHNLKPNWFAGIRTPWTLSSPQVWESTHRLGGRLFLVVGLLIALSALLLPPIFTTMIVIGGVLAIVGFSVLYSYVEWRRVTQGS